MSKQNKNNIIITILFLVYIFATMIFTIKYNFKDIKKTIKSIVKTIYTENIPKGITNFKNGVEQTFSNDVYLKNEYIDVYGMFQKVLNKNVVEDVGQGRNVVKLSDGGLTFVYPSMDETKWVNKISTISEYSKNHNIYMTFAMAPWRVGESSKLPFYIEDYTGDVSARFLEKIKKNGVNVIDFSKELDCKTEECFFKSDHHWNIGTAFKAYQNIAYKLNKDVGLNLTDKYLNDFSSKNVKKVFLGSYGKRTGKFYSKVDDFEYIYPNFATSLEVINSNWDKEINHLVGKFDNTLIYKDYLKTNYDKERNSSVYYTYTNGGKALVRIINHKSPNNKKILILKDSFAEPVFSFLSLDFKETRAIDVRCWKNIKLKQYIDKYKPDVLLFLHTPSSLYDDGLINFKWQ